MSERIYCRDCDKYCFTVRIKGEMDRCTHVIETDPNHPIRPQVTLGDCMVLNKDGNCPHFKDRQEGLGMADNTFAKHLLSFPDNVDE